LPGKGERRNDAAERAGDGTARGGNALATPVVQASGLTHEAFAGLDGMTYGDGATLALGDDLDAIADNRATAKKSGDTIPIS
jgi:hypothetical protein